MKAGIKIFIILFLGLLVAGGFYPTATGYSSVITTNLQREARELGASEKIEAVIRVRTSEREYEWRGKGVEERGEVVQNMRKKAENEKADLKRELRSMRGVEVKNEWWITSALLVKAEAKKLEKIALRDDVKRIHENFEVTILGRPSLEGGGVETRSESDFTWGLERVNIPKIWEMGFTGSEDVKVAVLDSGLDITHPDLEGKLYTSDENDDTYPGGWAEFDSDGKEVDGSEPHETYHPLYNEGHGTHVSGTVVGGGKSGEYIGVVPDTSLAHGLVLPQGGGTFSQIIGGMEWAVTPKEEGGAEADVVNMSFGADGYLEEMEEPVENIKNAGAIPVGAIGNSGEGVVSSPGAVYETLAIGASDSGDDIAGFSSGGVVEDEREETPSEYIKPDFVAPGVGVKSALPDDNPEGDYGYWDGTSMAAPHVAGVVALMLEVMEEKEDPYEKIYKTLKETAEYYENGVTLNNEEDKNTRYGYGVINAHEAIRSLRPIFTLPAKEVTHTSVTLRGDFTIDEEKEVFFEYRKKEKEEWEVLDEEDRKILFEEGVYEIEITGLEENTEYEFRAVGENERIEGEVKEFITKSAPVIKTLETTDVSKESATLKGELESLGDEISVDTFFRYRVKEEGEWMETEPESVSETGVFSKEIEQIEDQKEYEYKAVVKWNGYEKTGNTETFFTENYPEVETKEAEDIGYYKATLRGEVISLGEEEEVEAFFEYRKAEETEWEPIEEEKRKTLTEKGIYEIEVTDLEENMEYEFRSVVKWEGDENDNTRTGSIVTFSTESYPSVETKGTKDIGYTSATFNGRLLEIGLEEEEGVEVFFEYKKDGDGWEEEGVKETNKKELFKEEEFNHEVDDLKEDTTYNVRAVVKWNEEGENKGEEVSFSTKKKPTVETYGAKVNHHNKAVLRGELVNVGLETVDLYFKKTKDGWNNVVEIEVEEEVKEGEEFEREVKDLDANTEYEYKAVVRWDKEENGEESEGEKETFVTELDPEDVDFSDLAVDPSEAYVDEGISFSVEVKNKSEEAGDYTARFKVDGEVVRLKKKEGIENTKTFSVSYNKSKAGTYTLTMKDGEVGTDFEIFKEPHVRNIEDKALNYEKVKITGKVERGLEEDVDASFQWRREGSSVLESTDPTMFDEEGVLEEEIDELEVGQNYEVRGVVDWEEDITKGKWVSFQTPEHPQVETSFATDTTYYSATLAGEVVEMGMEEEVYAYFEYGEEGKELEQTVEDVLLDSVGGFDVEVTELEEDTRYEFRAIMEWGGGTEKGIIRSFQTDSEPEDNGNGAGGGNGNDNDDDDDREEDDDDEPEEEIKIEDAPSIREEVEELQSRKERLNRIRNMAQTLLEHPDLEEEMKETLENILQKSEELQKGTEERLEEKEEKLEKALELKREKEELISQKQRAERMKNTARTLLDFAEEESVKEVLREAIKRAESIKERIEERIEDF